MNTTEDLALGSNDGHFGNISTCFYGLTNVFRVFEGAEGSDINCC